MPIKFTAYDKEAIGSHGYAGPFKSRAAAQHFLDHCHATGRECARIASHSSQVMTSDTSPIVMNCKQPDVDSYDEPETIPPQLMLVLPYASVSQSHHFAFMGEARTLCGRDCSTWTMERSCQPSDRDSAYTCKRCLSKMEA